ncbi:MAG: aspartyl/asparaginyl beta-hydroxylase domain-containing protein [Proteobacteria bacterium]|nr:aspartyl/asparaginyl beta-hydroxylase domain-containing protein [Pseudomonadota bacterium]
MFVDLSPFPLVAVLEQSWRQIRDEVLALPDDCFLPWVQRQMYSDGWSIVPLCWLDRQFPGMPERCPHTFAALSRIAGLAMATFSRLAPETHVRPHVGWGTRVYRVHLGLKIPAEGTWLRVGAETKTWNEGGLLGFDDTVEHEASNQSKQSRVVLMLDILRPGVEGAPYEPGRVPPEVEQAIEFMTAER